MSMYTGEHLRAAAFRAMNAIWESNIRDPEDKDKVTALFVENGWGFQIPNGYNNQKGAEYCGHTVACAFRRVGDYLAPGQCVNVTIDPRVATRLLSSTSRLANKVDLEKEIPGKGWADLGYDRADFVLSEGKNFNGHKDIQPGDIVVVVTSAGKPHGDHITMAATQPDADGNFSTIEGNARGRRADGTKGKGVVKRTRNIRDVRQVIRLDERVFLGVGE